MEKKYHDTYMLPVLLLLFSVLLSGCGGGGGGDSEPTGTTVKYANLSTVGAIEIGRDFRKAQVYGNTAYYTDNFLGLSCVDITSPEHMTNKTALINPYHQISNLSGYDDLYDFIIVGNIAVMQVNNACLGMCMGDQREVQLYDISVPDKPQIISRTSIGADHIIADNNILYISSSSSELLTNNLYIVDISNPSNLNILSATPISDAGYIAKKGAILYLSTMHYNDIDPNKFRNIQIIDVSNPYNPVIDNPSQLISFNQVYSPILINDNMLYYLDYLGLNIVDITERHNPKFIKTIPIPSLTSTSFSLYNNHLYIAAGSSGLLIYDVSNPDSPAFIKSLKSDTDVLAVSVANGVGTFITDTLKQQSQYGYSIIGGNKINLFYDK